MSAFTFYTIDNAPEQSKPLLQNALNDFGMIPNLHAVMAESPELLEGYQVIHNLFQKTSFDADELTVVWQTINVEHACHYCVPAHTAVGMMIGSDPAISDCIRNNKPLTTDKLEVLRQTTLAMTIQRGVLTEEQVNAFFAAGYAQKQLLEIVLGLSQKVMSNYTNHLAKTPVDEAFTKFI
jgi:alkylhydroperoxidase family enzyme